MIVVGSAFDFTNGFHDTANAVATSIATGALKPRVAVLMSGCLNLVGAFISIKVAATIATGIINPNVISGNDGLELVLAALTGAIRMEPDHLALDAPVQFQPRIDRRHNRCDDRGGRHGQ